MADASTLWWFVSIALIAVGIAGTVLPALPGVVLVLAGIVLGAWIDGFTRVSGWTVGVLAVLAAAAFAVDYLAALLGAKRAGASRLALAGAAIGTVAGIFTGLVGLLFMPLVGAVVGEVLHQQRVKALGTGAPTQPGSAAGRQAARVGLATWVGLLVGTVAKLVIVLVMVGVFAAAVWF